MKYKAHKFDLMTVRSVPCSPVQYNSLLSGEEISLPKKIAAEMLQMNVIREVHYGDKSESSR